MTLLGDTMRPFNPWTWRDPSKRTRYGPPRWLGLVTVYPDGHAMLDVTHEEVREERTRGMSGSTYTHVTVATTYRCECGVTWTDTRHAAPPDHHVRERFSDHTRVVAGQRVQRLPIYGPVQTTERSHP